MNSFRLATALPKSHSTSATSEDESPTRDPVGLGTGGGARRSINVPGAAFAELISCSQPLADRLSDTQAVRCGKLVTTRDGQQYSSPAESGRLSNIRDRLPVAE